MWYEILVFVLFCLAIIDLTVGVSNDAANFLNSAIGSKVASFNTILIIASIGVLAGAVSSEGMMEVARKGIFVPSFFTFDNIMLVFVAVMLTDIILLDFYNSIGLPTSTTVSIVFELLGAGFIIGLLYSYQQGMEVEFAEFINFSTATKIISGIFLSVLVAFSSGALVQFITRLLFTFNLKEGLRRYGSAFGGIAITAITYFLVIKGLKGASFIGSDTRTYISEHTWTILGVSAVAWTIITFIMQRFLAINPLKFIVLAGTFSLAMAFAGNDLVNFIGVTVAGWQSLEAWSASGMAPDLFFMDILGDKAKAPLFMLLGAGAIMVVTLWTSKKARNVSQTEVKLARQGDGDERFNSNALSRGIVGGFVSFGKVLGSIIGQNAVNSINARFTHDRAEMEDSTASFDLLRASVNLMTASILISYATSLKLPLSTTYVSFMVAMGTSLADRAWGMDSAVYRVAGVLQVVGGWIMTAVIAFIASATFGLIMFYGGKVGVITIVVFAAIALVRSHLNFKNSDKIELDVEAVEVKSELSEQFEVHKSQVADDLRNLDKMVTLSLRSLVGSNKDILFECNKRLESDGKKLSKDFKNAFASNDAFNPEDQLLYTELHIHAHHNMVELYRVAAKLSENCLNHITNFGGVPRSEYLDLIIDAEDEIKRYIDDVRRQILSGRDENSGQLGEKAKKVTAKLNKALNNELAFYSINKVSNRLVKLQVNIILDLIELVKYAESIYRIHNSFNKEALQG
jgi:phosphate/sulfate permease